MSFIDSKLKFGLSFTTFLIVLMGGSWVCSADEIEKPSREDITVSKLVASLMQEDHLSTRPLDDTISKRAFDMYIKSLDPMKVYFLQSDVDEFSAFKTELDDQMQAGDFSAAFTVFNRFLSRVDQRVATALKLIDKEFDYTLDEDMVTDRDAMEFPKTNEEAEELWRKRIKYNLLVMKGDDDEDKDADKDADADKKVKKKEDPQERLRKRYRSFQKRMHQTDTQDVVEMYVSAITTSFDPHTTYMSKENFDNFMIAMSLELDGIGATLQATDEGYTVIKRIVVGGAADKQGDLKVEDKIISVAQGNEAADEKTFDRKLVQKHGTDTIDVVGMKLDDVVGMIRGKAGTTVRLTVIPENGAETKVISIVREKIKLEDSAARGVVFEVESEDQPLKIGVIDLPSFYADMSNDARGRKAVRSTTADVSKILDGFKQDKVDAVVLDLRRNGGGSLKEAIECTGLFIDTGTVVQVKDAYGKIKKHNDPEPGLSWDKPLVVLTSKFSASASEILAGAVQDYGRGLVVGDTTTHGKGTVQNLVDLNQIMFRARRPPNVYGALKITMSQFYRPNGESTQKRGVLSDVVLPSISDHMDVGESDLDYPVEFDQISAASFNGFGKVTPEVLEKLRSRSGVRVQESDTFAERVKKIREYVKQKELKSVSLNEEKFMARRKELSAEKEDEKAIEDQVNPDAEIKRDYYMDEVLKIASDYVQLLKGAKLAQK